MSTENGTENIFQEEPATKQSLRAGAKLWLAMEDDFFGVGAARLLAMVEKTGAVRTASREMGMSYSKAMKILATVEHELNCVVVSRRVGGKSFGRATLTPKGKDLLKRYEMFTEECKDFIKQSFAKHFDGYACIENERVAEERVDKD